MKKFCACILMLCSANFATTALLMGQGPEDNPVPARPRKEALTPQNKGSKENRPDWKFRKMPPQRSAPDNLPPKDMPPENFQCERFKSFLCDTSLEDFIKLKELSVKDPEKFRNEVEKKFRERHRFSTEDPQAILDMAEEYRNAAEENSRQETLDRLKKALEEEFDKKMEFNRKRIRQAEQKLEQLKNKFKDRENRRDEIINEKIKELTRDPILNW